jgi:hypothetical protein
MTRPLRRLAAALTVALAGAITLLGLMAGPGAGPAGAHEGPGILVMESDTPTGTSHRYVIRLTWENDGHPAARATTVNLTPTAPDGAAQTPVPMTPVDDDGRFEATVDLAQPGGWKVRFTALNPSANVEVDVDVAPPTTTTAPTTTTEPPVITEPESGVDTEEASATQDDPGSDSTSGGGPIVIGVLIVVAVAAGAALAVAYRSKKNTDPTDDPPSGTTDDL